MRNIRGLNLLGAGMRCFLGAAVMMSLVGTAGSAVADTAKDIKSLKKTTKSLKAKLAVIETAVNTNGIRGAQGEQGVAGPVGPRGADGARGPAGANGTNGANGAVGPQGPQGVAGTNGLNGSPGATGATGPQGPVGPQGPGADLGPITARVDALEGSVYPDATARLELEFNNNRASDIRQCAIINLSALGCYSPAGCTITVESVDRDNNPSVNWADNAATLDVLHNRRIVSAFRAPQPTDTIHQAFWSRDNTSYEQSVRNDSNNGVALAEFGQNYLRAHNNYWNQCGAPTNLIRNDLPGGAIPPFDSRFAGNEKGYVMFENDPDRNVRLRIFKNFDRN